MKAKRLLASVLAFVLCFSMLPTSAFAAIALKLPEIVCAYCCAVVQPASEFHRNSDNYAYVFASAEADESGHGSFGLLQEEGLTEEVSAGRSCYRKFGE